MQPGVEVADLCRREGLNPVLYFKRKKQLLGSASPVFEDGMSKPNVHDHRHEAELNRLCSSFKSGRRDLSPRPLAPLLTDQCGDVRRSSLVARAKRADTTGS